MNMLIKILGKWNRSMNNDSDIKFHDENIL